MRDTLVAQFAPMDCDLGVPVAASLPVLDDGARFSLTRN